MKRREFIKLGAVGTLISSVIPTTLLGSRDCDLTSPDILGPYWDENHPYRTILADIDEPGTRIFISGVITTNDCEIPISNAVVDVWHANDDGCYTVFQECDSGNPENDLYNLRGQMLTNENGEYAFETIWPGYYGSRPKHFHYKITTPDGLEHVTQCYFSGDPQINESWEQQHGDRIISLEESDEGLIGTFNVVMNEEGAEMSNNEIQSPVPENPYLKNNYPNPFNNSTQIEFGITQRGYVNISIYDINGKWIVNLADERMSSGTHLIKWKGTDSIGNSVPSGSYLIVLKTGSYTGSKKMVYSK